MLEFIVNVLALHFPGSIPGDIGFSKVFPRHWNPRRCQGLLPSSWIVIFFREQQASAFQASICYFKLQLHGDISLFFCAGMLASIVQQQYLTGISYCGVGFPFLWFCHFLKQFIHWPKKGSLRYATKLMDLESLVC